MSDSCCTYSLLTYPLPAPLDLAATPTDDSIALTWTAVEGAVSYQITWSPADGPGAGSATSTDPAYTIAGLNPGTQYVIAVVAVPAAGGEDVPSAPALITATTTGGPLATPSGFANSGVTATGATVSWTAVANANQYSVTYLPGGTTPQIVTSPTVNLTGLTPSTLYTVSVVAQDTTGASTDSAPGSTTVTTAAPGNLAAPTALASPAQTTTTIDLSWTASANATGYSVEQSPTGAGTWTEVGTPTGTTYTASGLTAATTYDFRVIATAPGFNDSPPSTVLTQATDAA